MHFHWAKNGKSEQPIHKAIFDSLDVLFFLLCEVITKYTICGKLEKHDNALNERKKNTYKVKAQLPSCPYNRMFSRYTSYEI